MRNPIGWFEIYVDDLARAKAFYEKVLDVSLTPIVNPTEDSLQMLAFPANFDDYGASGAIVKMQGVPAGQNSTLVYFACDNCALEEGRIEAAGGIVERSKMSIGEHGFISLGRDTEGNMIGFHSQQ